MQPLQNQEEPSSTRVLLPCAPCETAFVNQCKTSAIVLEVPNLTGRIGSRLSIVLDLFFGGNLSIELVKRPFAALVLVCLFTFSVAAQQTPAPANPDAASQTSGRDAQSTTQQSTTQQSTTQQDAPKQDVPQQNSPKDAPTSGSPAQGQSNPGTSSPGSTNSSSTGSSSTNAGSTSTQGKVAGTSNDRLFYTLPNFLTLENGGKLPPLSAKEKFKVVALGTFDPIQYPWWGILSAIDQASNSEPAYGQGWAAYGKRYGIVAADSTVENFMVGAVFPSILHQDPRFYQSSKGGFEHRTWYAITRIFVTRGDSGNAQFNFSEIFGSAFAAAVSTYSYHPKSTYVITPTNPHMFIGSDRTLANTASVWGTQIGLDTVNLVVKEFWPDIHRKLSHKQKSDAPQPSNSNR
jgi:hypothetical protein